MDILRIFEAVKIFAKDEKDTLIGLVFFLLLGGGLVRYVLIPLFPKLEEYLIYLTIPISIVIIVVWIYNRHISISPNMFTIGIAPFNLMLFDVKKDMGSEARRDLRNKLVDYVANALYFNKDNLSLGNYIEVIRLPNRVKVTPKNDKKWVRRLNVDLIIWGDAYYEGDILQFRPRFEFLKEPKNIFYKNFKKRLNELDAFKIDPSKSIEARGTELAQLMHYISFLGSMFHGIEFSNNNRFEEAQKVFEFVLKSIGTKSFNNKSLSDIYLSTRFFYAQNFHHWGNYVLSKEGNKEEALKNYERGAKAFFKRAIEIDKSKNDEEGAKLEHTLLYGIYLLIKKEDYKAAEKKLDSIKKEFGKDKLFLYYLYKGLSQTSVRKAKKYFDACLKRVKAPKDKELCFEKIAEYFLSNGKINESVVYFEKRLRIGKRQIYNPSLLEEKMHHKLAIAYAKQLKFGHVISEEIKAMINKQKNKSSSELIE